MALRDPKLLAALAMSWSCAAGAVDFGVMETADPIVPGHWKAIAYPLVKRAYPSQEQRTGVNVGVGRGLTPWLDAELQVASYDDESLLGGDLEFILRDGDHLDLSVAGELHFGNTDFGELYGYRGTAIASYTLPRTWLTLNGALDFGIDHYDFNRSGEQKFGTRSEEVHVVPGLQYRVSERVDVIGEVGVGFTRDARDYAALGFSIYFTHRPPPTPR